MILSTAKKLLKIIIEKKHAMFKLMKTDEKLTLFQVCIEANVTYRTILR